MVNRDGVLYLVTGLLAGFIGGYLMHEAMAARQPAPGWARGPAAGGSQASSGQRAPGPAAGAPAGGQAAMERVQRLASYVRENPNDANAVRELADLNYQISNWQRAAELYGRYLELDATDVDVMTDLGATYRYLGRPREALEQFRNVRELMPDHWQSRYNEVLILAFDLNDLPAAETAMAELAAMQPENPDVARLAAEIKRRAEGA